MVLSFLEKYQEELTSNKMERREDYDLLLSRIKENEKFLQMMKEEEQTFYSGFSPRENNIKNKEKIDEVEKVLSSLYDERETMDHELERLDQRLSELQDVIFGVKGNQKKDESESKDMTFHPVSQSADLRSSLETICQYVLSDPYRAKMELENIIQKI